MPNTRDSECMVEFYPGVILALHYHWGLAIVRVVCVHVFSRILCDAFNKIDFDDS